MKSQQIYLCTKKDTRNLSLYKKFIFPAKVVISKKCVNCENGCL